MSSKKNLKRMKPDSEGKVFAKAQFSSEKAQPYILAAILIFHILPLVLMLCGPMGKTLLVANMRFYVNPVIVAAITLVYGIKIGFNAKMPLVATLLSSASTIMYYNNIKDTPFEQIRENGLLYYDMLNFATFFVLYGVMSFIGIAIGSFIKKLQLF